MAVRPDPKAKTPSPRRIGAESSATRAALLDAAATLMVEEGYAAVTSRRLADHAGLKPALVHYYFRTMDDLFVALWRRHAEKSEAHQARAMQSAQPLRALWNLNTHRHGTAIALEFMALSRHRKVIRAELEKTGELFRSLQIDALAQAIDRHGLREKVGSAESLSFLMAGISRLLVLEDELGITRGHAEIIGFVEGWLTTLEGPKAG